MFAVASNMYGAFVFCSYFLVFLLILHSSYRGSGSLLNTLIMFCCRVTPFSVHLFPCVMVWSLIVAFYDHTQLLFFSSVV